MSQIKRYILEDDTDIEIDIFGLSCQYAAYRFAWLLNARLNFYFKPADDLHFSFPFFQFYDQYNRITYSLVQNKTNSSCFIPEQISLDYFLCIHSNTDYEWELLQAQLKQIPSVLAVFALSQHDIPSIQDSLIYFY